MKYDIAVGIDPGTHTGFSIWDYHKKELTVVRSCCIIEAMDKIFDKHCGGYKILMRIEDARQRKWFGARQSPKQEAMKLQGVGSVKRDCTIWEEFCEYHEIDCQMIAPKDTVTKTGALEFAKLTGWRGRTNEHARDAAMLVFGL